MAKDKVIKDFRQPADPAEQDEAEEQTAKKRRPRRKNWLRLLIRLLIVALILLAVYFTVVNWKDIAPDSFVSWMDDLISGTSGGTWPVAITGDNVTAMREVSSNLVALTDTATVYYNGSGAESVSRTHAFAKPMLRTGGKYVLVLELSGSRFRLETRSAVLIEQTVSNRIYTGAVSQDGDVAVVTDSSQSHISEVTVYSRKGTQRYQWLSAEWLVMDAAFSGDGNSLAVVACKSVNGAMQSAMMVFNLRNADEEPVQYLSEDILYTAVNYFSSGTVAAVGDTSLRVVNPAGTLDQTISYNDMELIGYCYGSGNMAVVTRSYGSQDGGTLTVLTAAADVKLTQTFDGVFRDLSDYNSDFLLLTDQMLYSTNGTGFDRQTEVAADSLMTAAVSGKPLVLGLTTLQEVSWQ